MLRRAMGNIPEWEVDLAITGAITLEHSKILLENIEKGEDRPFTTTVTLIKSSRGILCTLIARAYDQENARDAAIYFVGQALDVLSLNLDIPIYLNQHLDFRNIDVDTRRRIRKQEWTEAFRFGREYRLDRQPLSCALSWYRKGLCSESPIDQVMSYWNALEVIGTAYHRPSKRTKLGAVNQICDCFDQLWGSVENWRVIPGNPQAINYIHELRNGLSHGYLPVDIETIQSIVSQLSDYQKLVHAFLSEWEHRGLQRERQNEHAKLEPVSAVAESVL